MLAAYATLNGIVAAALLATAGFFWYQLFGDLGATLAHHGLGRLAGPRRTGCRPRAARHHRRRRAAARHVQGARDIGSAIVFRLQWRWRIPATRHLAAAIPSLAGLSSQQLGVLAATCAAPASAVPALGTP